MVRPVSATPQPPSASPSHGRQQRPASTTSLRPGGSGAGGGGAVHKSPHKVTETEFIQNQLREILREHAAEEEKHRVSLVEYRLAVRNSYNENAVVRNIIAAAETRLRHAGTTTATVSVTEAEMEYLQLRINLAKRRMNRMTYDIRRLTDETSTDNADERRAEITRNTSVASAAALSGAHHTTFLRLQKLERSLDNILVTQGTVRAILTGYEAQADVLREEKRRYDNCMSHVEKEYQDRHRDHMQLAVLYQNAAKAYDLVASERASFLRNTERIRRAKERALAAKTAEVNQSLRETQRQEQKIADLQQQLDDEDQLMESEESLLAQLECRRLASRNVLAVLGGGSSSDPAALQSSQNVAALAHGVASAKDGEQFAAYQMAFQSMMKTAGVTQLQDLVTVFESEYQRQNDMKRRVAAARADEERLRVELKQLQASCNANRYCTQPGVPQQPFTSKLLTEEMQTFIGEERTLLQETVSANAAKEFLLADAVGRVNSIIEKTAAYRPDVDIPVTLNAHHPAFPLRVVALTQKLLALADDATRRVKGSESPGVLASVPVVRDTPMVIPQNNVRVPLRRKKQVAGGASATLRMLSTIPSAMTPNATAGLPNEKQQHPLVHSAESVDQSWGSLHDMLVSAAREKEGTANSDASSESFEGVDEGGTDGGRLGARQAGHAGGANGHWGTTDADDDPLRREEIKRMSAAILRRETHRRERELHRTAVQR